MAGPAPPEGGWALDEICTTLMRVTHVRPAASAAAARWLLTADVDWWDLVRYGPPGFEVYVRVALRPLDDEASVETLRETLATLAQFTTTPDRGYAAIWEGWGAGPPTPQAPRVHIPHREMLLFTGHVGVLRDAPALAWYGSAEHVGQEPHLVWPEDQAWCLACEVDEEIEFSVGCSNAAAGRLAVVLPGAVRRVTYGERAPLYGDIG